jgi:acyl carrier protein
MNETQIRSEITQLLQETINTWNLGEESIHDDTRLIGDLGFASVDLIHLMASIEMRFHRKFPYDEIIIRDGQYVDDITVLELINFVSRNLNREIPAPQAM